MNNRRHIVQEYISSPLLLDMLKFDLRVYVVITSIDPLEVSSTNVIVGYCAFGTSSASLLFSTNIRINFVFADAMIPGNICAADSTGLSLFKFVWGLRAQV